MPIVHSSHERYSICCLMATYTCMSAQRPGAGATPIAMFAVRLEALVKKRCMICAHANELRAAGEHWLNRYFVSGAPFQFLFALPANDALYIRNRPRVQPLRLRPLSSPIHAWKDWPRRLPCWFDRCLLRSRCGLRRRCTRSRRGAVWLFRRLLWVLAGHLLRRRIC